MSSLSPLTTINNTIPGLSAGKIDEDDGGHNEGGYNAEASAEIPFGVAVTLESSTAGAYILPSGGSDAIEGIVRHLNEYANALSASPELGEDGILPEARVSIRRRGKIKVVCEDGCDPGDRLYVRYAGSGQKGACLAGAVSMETIDCTKQGVWRSSAGAGEVALLEVDFTNKA